MIDYLWMSYMAYDIKHWPQHTNHSMQEWKQIWEKTYMTNYETSHWILTATSKTI
jgi:hypothetical protein